MLKGVQLVSSPIGAASGASGAVVVQGGQLILSLVKAYVELE